MRGVFDEHGHGALMSTQAKTIRNRKQWVIDGLKQLRAIFPMEVCAYAVLGRSMFPTRSAFLTSMCVTITIIWCPMDQWNHRNGFAAVQSATAGAFDLVITSVRLRLPVPSYRNSAARNLIRASLSNTFKREDASDERLGCGLAFALYPLPAGDLAIAR
jgi:hypothetical protein